MSRAHKQSKSGYRGSPGFSSQYPTQPTRSSVPPLIQASDDNRRSSDRQRSIFTDWLFSRRSLNVSAALVLILITAPLMAVIALAIRLTSRGPIIFSQPRVGVDRRRDPADVPVDPRRRRDLGGRIFRIYKFRTMVHDPESSGPQRWASRDDPRVTAVGSILRKFRLDELPQLFNVLKGDMNLVGPRPEQPEIFQRLRDEVEGYQRRQWVLPGITGLAQVNLNYDQCLDDVRRKVRLDLDYVERVSPFEDVKIMARTVPVVLFGKGSQ